MSLDPRPENYQRLPKRNWEDLNRSLQFYFKKGRFDKPFFIVNVNEYEMTKEEIIKEAESKGYKVTDLSNNELKFE